MIKSILKGYLNRQVNIGRALLSKVENVYASNDLNKLYGQFTSWDSVNSFILKNGFTSDQQHHLSTYNNKDNLGNVNEEPTTFEKRRKVMLIALEKKSRYLDLLSKQIDTFSNRVLLPIDEEHLKRIDISEQNLSSTTMKKIFISHSSKDKAKVGALIDLLEAIGLQAKQIFCTSYEGYGIPLGEDFLVRLKKELDSEVFVLFIFSQNFFGSPISLCEMGATWIKTNKHIPILIPPFSFSDIKGVFPNTQGMQIDDKDKLNSLKESIEGEFKLSPISLNIWEKKRETFINAVK